MAIVTICRGTKSGGQALAECLAEALHYPILGREILQHAAAELGVSEEDLSRGMERPPRFWDQQASARRVYMTAVQAVLAEHVAGGNLVYHGRAGQLLLPGLPAVLRIRLIAPLSARVRVLEETERMDRATAEEYIRHVDGVRARWVKTMYGKDVEDPVLYDMVVNLKTLTVPGICAVVARALQRPEFTVTDDVRAKFMDFRLACRVKAALASAAETRALALEVEAHGGTVEISGSAPVLASGQTGDQIAEIARAVPGVEKTHLKVEWFDPYP